MARITINRAHIRVVPVRDGTANTVMLVFDTDDGETEIVAVVDGRQVSRFFDDLNVAYQAIQSSFGR